MKPILILNQIQTPDSTILKSYSVHDFKLHIDNITGETYFIDGGNDYTRTCRNKVPAKDISIWSTAAFETIRESVRWGSKSHGVTTFNFICNLSDDHIRNILVTQKHIGSYYKSWFILELMFRECFKIHPGKEVVL